MRIKAAFIPLLLIAAALLCSSTRLPRKAELNLRHISLLPFHPQDPDTAVVRIIGDVMLHSAQINRDYSSFLSGIEDDLKSADLTIANMEFALGGEPYSGYPAFSAPDAYAEYAVTAGINVFLTANNHIMDKGQRGLNRTLSIYDRMEAEGKAVYTGSGADEESYNTHNPLYVRANGIKIAIVNPTYGTNADPTPGYPKVNRLTDTAGFCAALREARDNADYVIALPHWGDEYKTKHNYLQKAQAQLMANNGADIIIGAHPHVVQDKGVVKVTDENGFIQDIPVFYSIGNAVSNMSAKNTQLELMVTLTLIKYPDGSLKALEPTWDWLWCSLPGKLCNNYKTIKVKDYWEKRDEWISPWEYDKMISTWNEMMIETGLY